MGDVCPLQPFPWCPQYSFNPQLTKTTKTNMGIDATICWKAKPAWTQNEYGCIKNLGTAVPCSEYNLEVCPGATHELDTGARYYGEGYERGPWPKIAAVLMELMQDPDIEGVWYGGDDWPKLMTPDELIGTTRHYIANGERPYRNAFRDLNIPNYQPKTT